MGTGGRLKGLSRMSVEIERAAKVVEGLKRFRTSQDGEKFPDLAAEAERLERRIEERLAILGAPEKRVAFVAPKGTGKSTLINALAELWLTGQAPGREAPSRELNAAAILPLGNGGTTPCEIVIEPGPWRIRIEPSSLVDARKLVTQFAEWGWHKAHDGNGETEDEDGEDPPLSGRPPKLEPDVERVIRGITGLGTYVEEIKDQSDNAAATRDTAPSRVRRRRQRRTRTRYEVVDRARSFPSDRDGFVRHVLELSRLGDRNRSEWLPAGDERRWMRNTLQDIFEGKFPEQPIPKRIFLSVPGGGIEIDGVGVPIVDTLGLPAVSGQRQQEQRLGHPLAERDDLRELMKQPWTLTVLASPFEDPPGPSAEILREMMQERNYFGETIEGRTVVAVVDPGKAGNNARYESAEQERDEKFDRCVEQVMQLGCPGGLGSDERWTDEEVAERTNCVNILDNIEDFRDFLIHHVESLAGHHLRHLVETVGHGRDFLGDLADAQGRERRRRVLEEFDRHLAGIWDDVRGTLDALCANVVRPLAEACLSVHHSSLRSMVIWRGDGTISAWSLFEASFGRALARRLDPVVEGVKRKAAELRRHPNYQGADDSRTIDAEVNRRIEMLDAGLTALTDAILTSTKRRLNASRDPWDVCESEWGAGIRDPKYKARVADHFVHWGERNSRHIMSDVTASFEDDPDSMAAAALVGPESALARR